MNTLLINATRYKKIAYNCFRMKNVTRFLLAEHASWGLKLLLVLFQTSYSPGIEIYVQQWSRNLCSPKTVFLTETRNNCFRLKKCSTTFCVLFTCSSLLTCFRLTKGRATFFRPETIVASFLHLMALFFKVIFQRYFKRQFVVLLFHNY